MYISDVGRLFLSRERDVRVAEISVGMLLE